MNNTQKIHEIEAMLKKFKCHYYKLNKEELIIKNTNLGGGSSQHIRELVDITTYLSDNKIRYIMVEDSNIQIEK